jgi:DNA-directed RNA polymerase specialized sigma24 family protein
MSTGNTTSSNVESDLRGFAADDEAVARRAFDRLASPARRVVLAYLRKHSGDAAECEDLAQETLASLWAYRARFRNQGAAAWVGLLRQVARQRLIDRRRAPVVPTADPPDWDSLPEGEQAGADLLAAVALEGDTERLLHAADVCWLGVDRTLAAAEHRRRLLAAQAFYLDGAGWEAISEVLGLGVGPSARRVLDEWLADASVQRSVAHAALYVPNAALAQRLVAAGDADGPWSAAEAAALGWRYGYALRPDQILARRDCRLSPEELEGLCVRSKARLPFMKTMQRVLDALERSGGTPQAALAEPGLWRRLVFDCAYREELPHRDILERLGPAAEVVGYPLTAATLNGWLSGGRLLRQLAGTLGRRER